MITTTRLGDLDPNPFRHLETYPIFREKVEALKESIQATNLWPRLMGRRRGKKIQIPYGHHLKQALLELYGPDHIIEIEVRDFSDAQMLMIMARENMQEYGADPLVYLQTVSAVIEAYGSGAIILEPPKGTSGLRQVVGRHYNALSLARFLGWLKPSGSPSDRIYWVLESLDLMEAKLLRAEELRGLTGKDTQELIRELTRRKDIQERYAQAAEEEAARAEEEARKAAEAHKERVREAAEKRAHNARKRAVSLREDSRSQSRHIVDTIGKELREGSLGSKEVRHRVAQELGSPFAAASDNGPKDLPLISQFARQMASSIEQLFNATDNRSLKIKELIDSSALLDKFSKNLLVGALRALVERLTKLADALDQSTASTGHGRPVKSAGPKRLK